MELDINGAKILFTLPIDLPVLGPLRISETMVVSWIVMLLITGVCIWLTHDLKEENISKRQAVAELLVETANKFVVGNMGEKFRYMIPFVALCYAGYYASVAWRAKRHGGQDDAQNALQSVPQDVSQPHREDGQED